MDVTQIVNLLADFVMSAVLLFMLDRVWGELKETNSFIRDLLMTMKAAAAERDEMRQRLDDVESQGQPVHRPIRKDSTNPLRPTSQSKRPGGYRYEP
jgi:hypothetical protein